MGEAEEFMRARSKSKNAAIKTAESKLDDSFGKMTRSQCKSYHRTKTHRVLLPSRGPYLGPDPVADGAATTPATGGDFLFPQTFVPESGHIFIDGACTRHQDHGPRAGVGIYFGPDHPLNTSDAVPGARQTSTRAELLAAVLALEQTGARGCPVYADSSVDFRELARRIDKADALRAEYRNPTIHTDSKYVIDCATAHLENWIHNKPLHPEFDLFMRLQEALSENREVQWVHTPAHCGHPGNEIADRLAKAGCQKDNSIWVAGMVKRFVQ